MLEYYFYTKSLNNILKLGKYLSYYHHTGTIVLFYQYLCMCEQYISVMIMRTLGCDYVRIHYLLQSRTKIWWPVDFVSHIDLIFPNLYKYFVKLVLRDHSHDYILTLFTAVVLCHRFYYNILYQKFIRE